MRWGNIGKFAAAFLLAIGVTSACGGSTDTSNGSSPNKDAGTDATPDVGVADVAVDVVADDVVDATVAEDSANDVGADVELDAGFVPSSLTNLILWLAADVGVTPGAGSSVAKWDDQSGQNNHASVNDPEAQPQVLSNALDGKPVIHFDGGLHYLSLPSGFADFSAGFSAFVVTRPLNNGVIHGARFFDFALSYGSLTHSLLLTRYEQADEILYQTYPGASPGANLDVNNTVVNGAWQTFEVIHAAGTPLALSSASLYKDGVLVSNGQISVPSNVTRSSNLIGRSNLAQDAYLKGDIAEIVMYARALSDAERQQIEAYLNIKWAL